MAPALLADGIVEVGKSYPLETFKAVCGLGTAALREARKNGLPVRRVGLRSYILGKDWLDYLETHGKPV